MHYIRFPYYFQIRALRVKTYFNEHLTTNVNSLLTISPLYHLIDMSLLLLLFSAVTSILQFIILGRVDALIHVI